MVWLLAPVLVVPPDLNSRIVGIGEIRLGAGGKEWKMVWSFAGASGQSGLPLESLLLG